LVQAEFLQPLAQIPYSRPSLHTAGVVVEILVLLALMAVPAVVVVVLFLLELGLVEMATLQQ
jgi:hypothetical protein